MTLLDYFFIGFILGIVAFVGIRIVIGKHFDDYKEDEWSQILAMPIIIAASWIVTVPILSIYILGNVAYTLITKKSNSKGTMSKSGDRK